MSVGNVVAEKAAKRVTELVTGGMELKDALTKVLEEAKIQVVSSAPRGMAISRIKKSRNIPELRNIRKIAYAKISKSKGNEPAIARYRLEVKAAEAKLNVLLGEVSQARYPWKMAMKLGEDAAGAFNYYLETLKNEVDQAIVVLKKQRTNAQVKAETQVQDIVVPDQVPAELKPAMQGRIKNGDMQVITICRQLAFIGQVRSQQSAS